MTTTTKYRCPRCGGTDLRVDTRVTLILYPDGDTELPDFDAIPGCVECIESDAHVACRTEDCEHESTIDHFAHNGVVPYREPKDDQLRDAAEDLANALERFIEPLDDEERNQPGNRDAIEALRKAGREV